MPHGELEHNARRRSGSLPSLCKVSADSTVRCEGVHQHRCRVKLISLTRRNHRHARVVALPLETRSRHSPSLDRTLGGRREGRSVGRPGRSHQGQNDRVHGHAELVAGNVVPTHGSPILPFRKRRTHLRARGMGGYRSHFETRRGMRCSISSDKSCKLRLWYDAKRCGATCQTMRGHVRNASMFCSNCNDLSHVSLDTRVPPKVRDAREADVTEIAKGSLQVAEASAVASSGRSGPE